MFAAERDRQMTIQKFKALVVMASAIALAMAEGQSTAFQARIPFAFVVDRQTLPAGTYLVETLPGKTKDGTGVVVIRNEDDRFHVTAITSLRANRARGVNPASRLSFTKSQGKNYLSRFSIAGERKEHEFLQPVDETATPAPRGREVVLTSVHQAVPK
jgi:hypothetical protein